PPEALFNEVLAAIRRDALGQADFLSGVVGRIDTPPQAPHGVGEWLCRTCRTHTDAFAAHESRWARAVATFGVCEDVRAYGDMHQPCHATFGQYGLCRLGRRCFVRHAWLALLAFL